MVSVLSVANWFLSKDSLTLKRLQSLCYYAQAWYCTLYDGTPFFSERIEAWAKGPNIPKIYAKYASYGWTKIPKYTGDVSFNKKQLAVLNGVFNSYSKFEDFELQGLMCMESPWKDARRNKDPLGPSTNEITTRSMRKYYRDKYIDAKKSQTKTPPNM